MLNPVCSNFDLICQEYPFISDIPGTEGIRSAYVTRFDEPDIHKIPYQEPHPEGWDAINLGKFFLLSAKGEIITEVGENRSPEPSDRDETLRSAIRRIGERAKDVIYGIRVEDRGTVGICKMPHGVNNAHTWMVKADRKSLAKIRTFG